MCDDNNSILLFQINYKVFNLRSGNWVECGGWFVHQQNFRLYCQRSGDAKPLLLSTGHPQCRFIQPVFDFVPDGCIPQRFFYDFIQLAFRPNAMRPRTIGNVIINTHRKRVCLLKHHTHPFPQQVDVHRTINIFVVQPNIPCNLTALHQIIHSIQGTQQGGLAATGWSNKCRHFIGWQV